MPDGETEGFGGEFPMPDGELPESSFNEDVPGLQDTVNYEEMDGIERTGTLSSSLSLSGTYETKQDYINALNANDEWVTWDEDTNEVTITDIASFTQALKNASKSIAAFDQLDRGQGENVLFGYGSGSSAHFDR